jgi:hypothetical protein
LRITIFTDGATDPPGSADYVTESIQPDGLRMRHYVCRHCLEVFDAPDGADTVHVCANGEAVPAP